TYMEKIDQLINHVTQNEAKTMARAAEQIATALQADGVLHLFGSGHSQINAKHHLLGERLLFVQRLEPWFTFLWERSITYISGGTVLPSRWSRTCQSYFTRTFNASRRGIEVF